MSGRAGGRTGLACWWLAVYQSARAARVIDDVISHDDDDVINYVRPADTGKSIVTTDIRRAGWAPCGRCPAVVAGCGRGLRCCRRHRRRCGDRRAVAARRRRVSFQQSSTTSSHRSKSRRELARQVGRVASRDSYRESLNATTTFIRRSAHGSRGVRHQEPV